MYDKASLALIPSGYRNGELFSVLPANGDGDFNFARSSTATRVNKDGLIETIPLHTPRLDYPLTNGVVGDCPHLLLEPSRTNLLIQSVNLASIFAFNTGGGTLTANYGVSPDGSKTSTRVIVNDTSTSNCFEAISGGSGSFTYSLYYKGVIGETTTIRVITIGSGGADAEKSITFTGKWQREQITFQRGADLNYVYIVDYRSINGTATDFQVFGGQVEEGSYATSYIPTNGETNGVTRSADFCNLSGTSAEFNDSEGVLFAEISALANDLTRRDISISDGTTSNRVVLRYDNSSNRLRVFVNGTADSITVTGYTITDTLKIAYKYKVNDYAIWVNGTEAGTNTSSTDIPSGLSRLNFDQANGTNNFYGKVKQLIYFNEALSDSELQTLTS